MRPLAKGIRLLALGTFALVCAAPPAPAAYPGQNGKIVFSRFDLIRPREGKWSLWAINADGSDPQLLREGGVLANPVWSPAGTRLAYVDGGTFRVQHVPLAATSPLDPRNPSWSPDAARLVFDGRQPAAPTGRRSLFLVNHDGRRLEQLTRGFFDRGPAWSPDGRWIAFSRYDGTRSQLFLIAADGRRFDTHPAWSPDGTKIVFETMLSGLDVVNRDGTGRVALLRGGSEPDWQPLVFDLALGQDVPGAARVGRRMVLRYWVSNIGFTAGPEASLRMHLSAAVRFVAMTPERGACARRLRIVSCALGDLAPGETARVRIVVRPRKAGRLTSEASVSTSVDEVDKTSNRVRAWTRVRRSGR